MSLRRSEVSAAPTHVLISLIRQKAQDTYAYASASTNTSELTHAHTHTCLRRLRRRQMMCGGALRASQQRTKGFCVRMLKGPTLFAPTYFLRCATAQRHSHRISIHAPLPPPLIQQHLTRLPAQLPFYPHAVRLTHHHSPARTRIDRFLGVFEIKL